MRSGVLIIPPFGWEDVCSHRPLRALARNLTLHGFAAFRFDLPGTGDSSGSALDHNLFPAWIESVKNAAAEFVKATGVESVSVLGVRLGAALALAAISDRLLVDNLILWNAAAKGRSLLRELRVLHTFEAKESASGGIPSSPLPGLEAAGFLINPETERALETFSTLDLAAMPGKRVLLLSRDHFPHDTLLVESLERAGCEVTAKSGVGYQAMMTTPDEAASSTAAKEIIHFLPKNPAPARETQLRDTENAADRSACAITTEIIETVHQIPYAKDSLFALRTEPSSKPLHSNWCLLFLNAGGVRHIGPNRMWVEAARRWAVCGVPSIRLDFRGLGESNGHHTLTTASFHDEDLGKQLDTILAALRTQSGSTRFLAIGLCAGAYAAFQGALHNPVIQGAIALNPEHLFWDPAVDRRRFKQRIGKGLRARSKWLRLTREKLQPSYLKRVSRELFDKPLRSDLRSGRRIRSFSEAIAVASETLQAHGSRVTLVFADGEPLLQEMTNQNNLPSPTDSFLRCVRAGNVGHTYRQLWAQQSVHDLLDHEISLITGKSLRSGYESALFTEVESVFA